MSRAAAAPTLKRVAIYCRQSVEDTTSSFDSLTAQRQAVEAFILSQRGEGWVAMPEVYSDGGYSGSNIERPAFKRLLSDVRAGKIDAVCVYKLDRLSRSISDFLSLMEEFEKHGVVFTSVTQQFSTSTSVGRLTLHLLATFAQFEREQIGERTRDKMQAARRRGMWTGGPVPLGYDVREKKLIVNKSEADQVRAIFGLYLELGGILPTVAELTRRGWQTKSWVAETGKRVRGVPFGKETLRRMLRSPIYVGRMPLGNDSFEGQHEAIVERGVWDSVQAALKKNRDPRKSKLNTKTGALLSGLLHCKVCGAAMRHSFSAKNDRRWSYYVCSRALEQGAAACPKSRVQRQQIEDFVVQRIRAIGRDPKVVTAAIDAAKRDREARKPELASEARQISQSRTKLEAERRNLLDAVGSGGVALQPLLTRVAEIDEQVQRLDDRQAEVRAALARDDAIDEGALRKALTDFDGIWGELVTRERIRLLQLVVGEIRFDGATRDIEIDLLQTAAQRGAA